MGAKVRFAIVSAAVAAFWPWLGSPFEYAHWNDRLRASIPIAMIYGAPCEERVGEFLHIGYGPECYRYDAPRKFKGIWRDEFEGSSFFEGRTSFPVNDEDKREAWLSFPKETLVASHIKTPGRGPPIVVEIEFIGRRTSHSGRHGHLGLWSHDIIVDKIIAYRALGAPIAR